MSRHLVIFAAAASSLLASQALMSQEAHLRTQASIAQSLRQGDIQSKQNALLELHAMGAKGANAEVRSALRTELARTNSLRKAAAISQQPMEESASPEYIAELHRIVADTGDSEAIPLLADAMGSFTLIRQLVELGEAAAPHVISVTSDPSRHYSTVDDGLRVLRMMVEAQAISERSRRAIREVAIQRLTTEQYFTTLWYAIDLAASLNDTELDKIVESLASSADEVRRRGVSNPEIIEKTQQRARDRIAKLPALPQLPRKN